MEERRDKYRLPLWHSLMYSTGMMLIVAGVPAAIVTSLLLLVGPNPMSRPDAFHFGLCMVIAEVVIASILLFVARKISKNRDKERASRGIVP